MEWFYPARLIENRGRTLDKPQQTRHLVGEARSVGMQQGLDGAACLPITCAKGDRLEYREFAQRKY